MRIKYDEAADAARIYLTEIPPGGAPSSCPCDLEVENGAVILLLSPAKQLVGIEVLGASKILPAELLS